MVSGEVNGCDCCGKVDSILIPKDVVNQSGNILSSYNVEVVEELKAAPSIDMARDLMRYVGKNVR